MARLPESDPAVASIERAMVAIRRSQQRRRLARAASGQVPRGVPPAVIAVVDALDELASRGVDAPTVGDVAGAMQSDPSRASRAVAQAVEAGLVRRSADQEDGRRSCLELTARGRTLIEKVRASRRRFFAEATSSWSRGDREAFAALLTRFTTDLDALLGPDDED
ncbi:MarR family winged helix-turn-helix transcriptional regulator [Sandaracinus amylolyticus]|uniref:Transcriptional regulator, MarR family protein n=1 Tax=Sandaracinus amylolyticus TaxID=927083 RepID=A0A0F6YGM9_9BACT|nr:MarR family winged helix-turn-helix transcriptional regulator [Sandaracinus amylolyticus]AKF03870.1 Transcriptional regulator, MarR family protein [Sandaracinus amylolyticus]